MLYIGVIRFYMVIFNFFNFFYTKQRRTSNSEDYEFYCSRQFDDTHAYISSFKCLLCSCFEKYLVFLLCFFAGFFMANKSQCTFFLAGLCFIVVCLSVSFKF